MKTLSIIAAATVATLTIVPPASAQLAFGGDGLYGHDYTTSPATSPRLPASSGPRAISFGYPSNASDQMSVTIRSVGQNHVPEDTLRTGNEDGGRNLVPVQAPLPNAY